MTQEEILDQARVLTEKVKRIQDLVLRLSLSDNDTLRLNDAMVASIIQRVLDGAK